jgi:hypothetical protein
LRLGVVVVVVVVARTVARARPGDGHRQERGVLDALHPKLGLVGFPGVPPRFDDTVP